MTEYELKTWPEYFQAIVENRKPFEYRLNDRGYEVGDVLWLREFVPAPPDDENNGPSGETGGHYTGRELRKSVTYILDDRLGPTMREGFVVMGIGDTLAVEAQKLSLAIEAGYRACERGDNLQAFIREMLTGEKAEPTYAVQAGYVDPNFAL